MMLKLSENVPNTHFSHRLSTDDKILVAIDSLLSKYHEFVETISSLEHSSGNYLTFVFKLYSPEVTALKNQSIESLAQTILLFKACPQLLKLSSKLPELLDSFEENVIEANDSVYLSVRHLRSLQMQFHQILTLVMSRNQSVTDHV